jgi:hypothetical protein
MAHVITSPEYVFQFIYIDSYGSFQRPCVPPGESCQYWVAIGHLNPYKLPWVIYGALARSPLSFSTCGLSQLCLAQFLSP